MSHRGGGGSVVSESKFKVVMTLYRKIEKLSQDCMASELVYAINNKLDSRSQCIQIMQDHKNCDQLLSLGVKNL